MWRSWVLWFCAAPTVISGVECAGRRIGVPAVGSGGVEAVRGLDPAGIGAVLAESPWLLGHAVCGGLLVAAFFLTGRRASAWMALGVAVSWWMIPAAAVHLVGVMLLVGVAGLEREPSGGNEPLSGMPEAPRWGRYSGGPMAIVVVAVVAGWIFAGLRLRPEMVPPTASPDEVTRRGMFFLALTPAALIAVGAWLAIGARRGGRWRRAAAICAGAMAGFVVVVGLNWIFSYHFPDGWDRLRDRVSFTNAPWDFRRRGLTLGAMALAFLLIRTTATTRWPRSTRRTGSNSIF